MLRALTIHTVGQIENYAVLNCPLALTRSEIVVNDDLSAIGKITELSLPDSESVRVSKSITIFKSHSCVFAQEGVFNLKSAFFMWKQKGMERSIFFLCLLIGKHSVSMRESSPLNILSTDSYIKSLFQK